MRKHLDLSVATSCCKLSSYSVTHQKSILTAQPGGSNDYVMADLQTFASLPFPEVCSIFAHGLTAGKGHCCARESAVVLGAPLLGQRDARGAGQPPLAGRAGGLCARCICAHRQQAAGDSHVLR